LLVWARPPTPSVQASELLPIVREAVQAARLGPEADGQVSVSVALPEDLELARIDPPLLHRALVNLLTNALQHAPSGGHVRVSAASEPRGIVALRVENDGPPIPRDDARRIFDPFFTKRPRGTGLGLCVVKQLVEGMGGSVELERLADPVRFTIRLPVEQR
jgi:signal transduction histidine kinase